MNIEMTGVSEYGEDMPVVLCESKGRYEIIDDKETRKGEGRLVIRAFNEAGCNCTDVDLLELIGWLKENKPELLK